MKTASLYLLLISSFCFAKTIYQCENEDFLVTIDNLIEKDYSKEDRLIVVKEKQSKKVYNCLGIDDVDHEPGTYYSCEYVVDEARKSFDENVENKWNFIHVETGGAFSSLILQKKPTDPQDPVDIDCEEF